MASLHLRPLRSGYEELLSNARLAVLAVQYSPIASWTSGAIWNLMRYGRPDHPDNELRECYLTRVPAGLFVKSFEDLMLHRICKFAEIGDQQDVIEQYLALPEDCWYESPMSAYELEQIGRLSPMATGYQQHPLFLSHGYLQELLEAVNEHIAPTYDLFGKMYWKAGRLDMFRRSMRRQRD